MRCERHVQFECLCQPEEAFHLARLSLVVASPTFLQTAEERRAADKEPGLQIFLPWSPS